MTIAPRLLRERHLHFQPITMRWHDSDIYGHVNSVIYYVFFDTVVSTYLIKHDGLDIQGDEVIGPMVNSSCDYFALVAFPQQVKMSLRVARLSSGSVQYGLALFLGGQREVRAARRPVYIFVERRNDHPVAIPQRLRGALAALQNTTQ